MNIDNVKSSIERNNTELELDLLCRLRAYRMMRYLAIYELYKLIYKLRGNTKPSEPLSKETRAAVARFETKVFDICTDGDAALLHETVEHLDSLIAEAQSEILAEYAI